MFKNFSHFAGVILLFWLPYCSINYSIFQIVNSSFPPVLRFQVNLMSKSIKLPVSQSYCKILSFQISCLKCDATGLGRFVMQKRPASKNFFISILVLKTKSCYVQVNISPLYCIVLFCVFLFNGDDKIVNNTNKYWLMPHLHQNNECQTRSKVLVH